SKTPSSSRRRAAREGHRSRAATRVRAPAYEARHRVSIAGIVAAGIAVYFHSNRTTAEISPAAPKIEDVKNRAFQDCVNGGPLDFPTPPTALPPVGSAQRAGVCRDLVDQLQFNQAVDKRFHVTQLADVLQHVSAFAAIIAWLL